MFCTVLVFGMLPCAYGEMSLSTGMRYDWFHDDSTSQTSGAELTIPVGFAYKQDRLSLAIATAFASATVETGATAGSSISSAADTLVSFSYLLWNVPVGIMAGVDVNLPTGRAQLSDTEQRVEAGENSDLFSVDNFGEGLNVGLNLGVMKELGKVRLAVNGAYLFKGGFDPTQDIANDDLDPGDQVLFVGMWKWQAAAAVTLDVNASYAWFAADHRNGQEIFQQGPQVALGANLRVAQRAWGVAVGVQQAFHARNKYLELAGVQTETENSNGNQFFGLLDVTYAASPRFTYRFLGTGKNYAASDRQDTVKNLPYAGQRVRFAFGPGVIWTVNERLALNGLAQYFSLRRAKDLNVEQDTTFHGVNLTVGVTYTF